VRFESIELKMDKDNPSSERGDIISTAFTLLFSFKPKDFERNQRNDGVKCTIPSKLVSKLFGPKTMEPIGIQQEEGIDKIIPLAVHITSYNSSCPLFMSLICLHRDAKNWNCISHFQNIGVGTVQNTRGLMSTINAFQSNTCVQTLFDYRTYIDTPVFRNYGHITQDDILYEQKDKDEYLFVKLGTPLCTELTMSKKRETTLDYKIRVEREEVLNMVAVICSHVPPVTIMTLDDIAFRIEPFYPDFKDEKNYAWGNNYDTCKERNCTIVVNLVVDFIYPIDRTTDSQQ